jgi:hypothetical protein
MVYLSWYRASVYWTIKKQDKFVQFLNGYTSQDRFIFKETFLLNLKLSSLAENVRAGFQMAITIGKPYKSSGFRMVNNFLLA